MKWLVERNRRLGRTSIVSLLLAMVSMAPAVAQDGAFPDLEIVGASFTNPVEPGGSVTVEVTAATQAQSWLWERKPQIAAI